MSNAEANERHFERELAAERERIFREVVGPLVEALEKAEAGIADWRLGAEYADEDDMRQMTASNAYLKSVRDTIHAALANARAQMESK